jgi:hypothetical protein
LTIRSPTRLAEVPAGSGTQVLTLSLFLKLLALFILLNSFSQHTPDRTQKVADSLRLSLGNKVERGTGSTYIPGLQEQRGQGASLADLAGAFQAELPGVKANYVRQRGVMTLTLPASQFNHLMGLAQNPVPKGPLQDLLTAIKTSKRPLFSVRFQVNIRPDLYDSKRISGMSLPRYLPMWAGALARAGVDPERTLLAVGPGPAGTLTLQITPDTPEQSPKVTP